MAERAVDMAGDGEAQGAAASSRSESRASQPTRPSCSTANAAAASKATSRRSAGCGPEDPQHPHQQTSGWEQASRRLPALVELACKLATGRIVLQQ